MEKKFSMSAILNYETNPDRIYCEGRFLSLAGELSRMGYPHRLIAEAALTAALDAAFKESPNHYAYFLQSTESLMKKGIAISRESKAEKAEGEHSPQT